MTTEAGRVEAAASELEAVRRELGEARAQQAAMRGVLELISRSPLDLQPVFDALIENAVRLCGADNGSLFRLEVGDLFRHVAMAGRFVDAAAFRAYYTDTVRRAGRGSVTGRVVLEGRTVQIEDIHTDPEYDRATMAIPAGGTRTALGVPMLRQGLPIGVMVLRRMEVRPFTQRQIDLAESFANQAVIAIENVRFFNETKEALEQQTATSDVLKIISRSAFDLQPVLDIVVERAAKLCEADSASIARRESEGLRLVADYQSPPEYRAWMGRLRPMPDPASVTARATLARRSVQIADVLADPDYVLLFPGPRTILGVPMLREGEVIGVIVLRRNTVRPFKDKQILTVETFADQAVIAIENVRLFNETKEALDQQRAVAEVLGIISRSPFGLEPVLEAVAGSAASLCEADDVVVMGVEGDALSVLAHLGDIPTAPTRPITSGYMSGRAVLERRMLHEVDVQEAEDVPEGREHARRYGFHTQLTAPLLREGVAIGAIVIRRREIRPFTQRQIELLRTFADQAAIAIENVRLFNETKEALERQTAISEILNVISSSPTNVQPVLDAIALSARRFCVAEDSSVILVEGDHLVVRAHDGPIALNLGVPTADRAAPNDWPVDEKTVSGRAVVTASTVHVRDIASEREEYPLAHSSAQRTGVRTVLATPLLREGKAIGAILLRRREVSPFSDRQIELLETFAAQAVIAIENVRLFHETKEALEQQRAISDVLDVISRSPSEITPVFQAVVDQAVKLCEADNASILRRDGDEFHYVAHASDLPDVERFDAYWKSFPLVPGRGTLSGRVALAKRTVQIEDVDTDPEYDAAALAGKVPGTRTHLGVPLLKEGEPVGLIIARRFEVRPFTENQIGLLETFAAQAVIAIENARLFSETREALERQTAISEVLKVISRSAFDLQLVLDTVVENAARLCAADIAWLSKMEGDVYRVVAFSSTFPPGARSRIGAERLSPRPEAIMGRALFERRLIHVPDIRADEGLRGSFIAKITNTRTALAVPMLREAQLIGAIVLARYDVRPFSDRELELVRTFADQAVIAIENVRLFNEIQEKSHELEVASRHKSEFLANMSHELRTPLNAIIGFSEVMLEGMFGEVNEKQREYLQDILSSGRLLLSLISDILDLSKIEAGRVELQVGTFSLRDALANGVTMVRERATRHGVEVRVDIAAEIAEMEGDERKVKQIIFNLLSNAVKFTPDGGRVEFRARVRDGEVEVSVADTGIGIPQEEQERIFEEFHQASSARGREGTGLGLTLAKRFVELHGGTIRVESAVGVGSTFTFALPLKAGVKVAM